MPAHRSNAVVLEAVPPRNPSTHSRGKSSPALRKAACRTLATTASMESGWSATAGGCFRFRANDYPDLTRHPRAKQAAIGAIEKYGTGAGRAHLAASAK
jgi:7-keto-8-aminopelargonate synthetase-like enzyme